MKSYIVLLPAHYKYCHTSPRSLQVFLAAFHPPDFPHRLTHRSHAYRQDPRPLSLRLPG